MDSVRDPSRVDEAAAERQPFLPSPLSVDGRDVGNTAVASNDTVTTDAALYTTPKSGAKLGTCALNFFLSGIAVAGVGAMIPDVGNGERGLYHTFRLTDTALVFPSGVFGYLIATASVHRIHLSEGRRGIAIASSGSRLLFALILSSAPAFPLFLVSFAGFGFGTGLTDIAWNTWASSTSQPNLTQGILHGSFSVGCVAGPALVTVILRTSAWSALYGLLACALIVELSAQTWAFRNDRGSGASTQNTSSRDFKIQSLLRNSSLWLCGAYFLVYQGIEASFNDWIVLFLVRTRHADTATAASASSIFWLGVALGRYALGAVTEYFGLQISVSSYIAIACCTQTVLMSLRQIPGTLAVLGICGFFLAPLFPSGIVMLSNRTLPENRTQIIAAVIALGQIGGALIPYGLGLLATHLGTQYLLHVTLGLSVLLLGIWAAISRVEVDPVAEESSD